MAIQLGPIIAPADGMCSQQIGHAVAATETVLQSAAATPQRHHHNTPCSLLFPHRLLQCIPAQPAGRYGAAQRMASNCLTCSRA